MKTLKIKKKGTKNFFIVMVIVKTAENPLQHIIKKFNHSIMYTNYQLFELSLVFL